MEHVLWVTGGALPERLPTGDGPPSVPECVVTGRTPKHRPLPGPGLSPRGSIDRALSLTGEEKALSPATAEGSQRDRLPARRAPGGDPQAATVREAPSSVDTVRDLAYD